MASSAATSEHSREEGPQPAGETSTHVTIYTLYLSGFRQRYRHFVRQADGAITEVGSALLYICYHAWISASVLTYNHDCGCNSLLMNNTGREAVQRESYEENETD